MAIAERPTARERHFREMAVWHDWPVPDGPIQERPVARTNVAVPERLLSVLGGGALTAYGASRRTWAGWALAGLGAAMVFRGVSGHCPAYKQMRINTARRGMAEPADFYEYGIQVAKSVTINASPETLYRFWRDFTNLPRIMSHLKSVEIIDDLVSHWVAQGPLNSSIEWDAEIINEEPYELIAWRSLPGAEVDNAGSVRFVRAPGGRGTQVKVSIEYIPIAGRIGAMLAKLFGSEPNQEVQEDLRAFKQIMEAGETPSTQGQPVGQCAGGNRTRMERARQFAQGDGNQGNGVQRTRARAQRWQPCADRDDFAERLANEEPEE